MNEGVLMMLDRMKTNPEEFAGDYNRWSAILEQYDNVLAKDEAKAIKEELYKLRRAELTRTVMQEILREPTPVDMNTDKFTISTTNRDLWGSLTPPQVEVHRKALLKNKP